MFILYSINAWLAYKIAETYYEDKHYVWCSPLFNAKGVNPPSSDPCQIYNNLFNDVIGKDKHSSKITAVKSGIINGANEKHKQGIINVDQLKEIVEIVNIAEIQEFRPLIFVIPFYKVEPVVKPVPIKFKAYHFSKEFLIEELEKDHFDIIDTLNINYV